MERSHPFPVEEHALRKRISERTRRASSPSLGRTLLVIAFVPALALIALWAVTSGQVFLDFQRQAGQGLLAEKAGQPSNLVYYSLQEERRLSAEVLAGRSGAAAALKEQRGRTDEAVRQFQTLSDVSEDGAPQEVLDAVAGARAAIARLDAQRSLVDGGDDDQQQAVYDYYTDLIAVDLDLFAALSHVDNGRITTLSQPLVDLFRVKEMISRSDALLARGWADKSLSAREFAEFRQVVSAQQPTYSAAVVPYLPADEKALWDAIVDSPEWKAKTAAENAILAPGRTGSTGSVPLTADERTWRTSVDALDDRVEALLQHRTALVVEEGKGTVMSLLLRMALTTLIGLLAIVAVITVTWRLTRTLRRRIDRLREQAEALERSLPDIVERLGQGERIDVEAEVQLIRQDEDDHADDELTRLGEALNLARTSALEAAVRQSDQHRGFERLLQRIARRTQQLIGQQLKKLDDLEHRHEDPRLLEDLFDLDHLTARLRRYEENLVILAGGSPHRRWRRPVPLLDVMRSAQGEVQDYRRVVLDLDGSPWLAPRAVGPVTHVLAELIENALSFSRPPSPVEIRAAHVSRGLAVEVEDRGLGMEEEQLAELNELMARPPRMDLLARTEDIRLGLHVVSRLAAQYGLRVEFRSSAYGGTRAVVLVPHELLAGPGEAAPAAPQGVTPLPLPAEPPAPAGPAGPGHEEAPLPSRGRGRALAEVTGQHHHTRPDEPPLPYAEPQGSPFPEPQGRPFPEAFPEPYAEPHPEPYAAPPVIEPFPAPYAEPYAGPPAPEPYAPPHAPGAVPAPAPEPYPAAPAPVLAAPAPAGPTHPDSAPLPRRVRQASLVDELRVDPAASRTPTAPPPDWRTDPLLRPAPRRAGATIGAFQRRSRAARAQADPSPAPSTREDWS
ncbi:nitrate- and nitrite sensing domain-containing protein [Streptomyces sp. NPDC088090]|uniref:nitrate- and nitrite sensing domain-containing protein n=1 Tax=Streptomyces sp. NPDC088090 TaxID=3365822 RepID=UPI00384D7FEE